MVFSLVRCDYLYLLEKPRFFPSESGPIGRHAKLLSLLQKETRSGAKLRTLWSFRWLDAITYTFLRSRGFFLRKAVRSDGTQSCLVCCKKRRAPERSFERYGLFVG